MTYQIKIKKQYSKVLNLLGVNIHKDGKDVMCYNNSNFTDALEKLRKSELDEKIESAIKALGKTPETLYHDLITSLLIDEIKIYISSSSWGEVNENEIIDEIESRLSEYDLSFYNVVDFDVQSEPEIQMFGRFWALPTEKAFIYLDVIDTDEDERVFLLQIDNANNYEFDELEYRGS